MLKLTIFIIGLLVLSWFVPIIPLKTVSPTGKSFVWTTTHDVLACRMFPDKEWWQKGVNAEC